MSLLSKLFHYVLLTSQKYKIDESHGLSHSMNVLQYANKIYQKEILQDTSLIQHEKLIYMAAVLHDMCDKKYMDETTGIKEIEEFLQDENKLTPIEIEISKQIMTTMSYSKVKVNGFPNLGIYQKAYHVVREADLLSAYDFDRCIIYKINKDGCDFTHAYENAKKLFEDRVLKHNDDGLLLLDYSKIESIQLHKMALHRISSWDKLLKNRIL